MRAGRGIWLGLVGVGCWLPLSCSGNAEIVNGEGGAGGFAGSAGAAGSNSGGSGGTFSIDAGDAAAGSGGSSGSAGSDAGPACGDGKLDPGEKCDDGNGDSGDGCGANCDAIEKDFACPVPGMPCVSTVKCGDGLVTGSETCDDRNTKSGDGCNASCQVQPGWKCPTAGVRCEAAQCGDGIVAGNEQCDDANSATPGCNPSCQLQKGWVCDVPEMPCRRTTCGDGTAEGTEQCDDGNNDMGDGCTPFCVREPDCSGTSCKSTCGDGLRLPGDNEDCEDGNTVAGDGCSPTCKIEPGFTCNTVNANPNKLDLPIVLRDFNDSHLDFEAAIATEKGIVRSTLSLLGKPVYAASQPSPTTSDAAHFNQWYRDTTGVNQTVLQTLTLNRLPTGEFQFNDNTFFPLDGLGFGNQGRANNFHFTSEVRYWFEYKGGERLDFTGDDDVWVFVNKRLAIDLGGVHGAQSASVTLDAAAANTYKLSLGKVYEIVVFQAERHTTQSNYRLTLSNFDNQLSKCQSVCGDGILTADEACDDGVLDGSYGGCKSDCTRAPFCGDNKLQAASGEECDDGLNISPYGGCAPGCKNGGFCGDAAVDSLFGEACDDGVNDGGYGECAAGCLLGPRCGDGVVQASAGEQCDDGNKQNGDGCDANCRGDVPQ